MHGEEDDANEKVFRVDGKMISWGRGGSSGSSRRMERGKRMTIVGDMCPEPRDFRLWLNRQTEDGRF